MTTNPTTKHTLNERVSEERIQIELLTQKLRRTPTLNEITAIYLGYRYEMSGPRHGGARYQWNRENRLPNFRTDPLVSLQIEMHMAKQCYEFEIISINGAWLVTVSDEDIGLHVVGSSINRTEAVWKCWLRYMGWSEEGIGI